ncbi:hypothetical protein ABT224_41525 [Streptomyces sp. NPDC001584]|uniref:hypothetical protein n=1 Tax=Streptomyces sp. NPDC001584 TaxID=3154521 RepID=UPI003329545C
MGRQKKLNKARRTRGGDAIRDLAPAWDAAIAEGLMPSGNEVNYRSLLTGEVLSDAIGSDGQLLVDGRELTPAWAAELRETKPAFATLIDVFEEQAAGWTRISEMPPCEHSTCACTH